MRLALVLALGTLACPTLPAPSGCTPHAYRCNVDIPEVCSQTQRWTQIGDGPCSAFHATCTLRTDGVAFCAPLTGGTP